MGVACLVPLSGYAAKGNLENVGAAEAKAKKPTYITLGKAELVGVGGDVADVMVANPAVIDVSAVQSDKLYIVGLTVGDTNVIALDSKGNVLRKIDVHVRYDLQAIQSMVDELFPDEEAQVKAVHDQIVLTGKVSTPEKASKIANLVGHYVGDLQDDDKSVDEMISNLLEVRGEQQVMLQVRIVEATRSVLRELGIETDLNDTNELSTTTIFGTTPSTSQFGSPRIGDPSEFNFRTGAGIGVTEDPAGVARLLFDSGIAGIGTVGAFLNALEEENLVNVLAEPNLTAVSGEQAGFLAGGEFPVPVGRDQVGNIVVEFREFGVSLNFKPVVLSDKRISLQLNTEVSSLDFDSAIVLADLTVPGLDVRRAETTVEMPSGGSLMIAGLLQSEAVRGMAGLPGIRKTPILGDLISSDSFQRDETELVVIITPYLVDSFADKTRAETVPEFRASPLAKSFETNMKRSYDIKDEELFMVDGQFGYLLD